MTTQINNAFKLEKRSEHCPWVAKQRNKAGKWETLFQSESLEFICRLLTSRGIA